MRHFLSLVATALMAGTAFAATQAVYVNSGTTNNPQIDATSVINHGVINTFTTVPYDTANTLYYSNSLSGVIFGDVGPRFEFVTNGLRRPAASFANRGLVSGSTHLLVTATNISNTGTLAAGPGGLVRLTGNNIDVQRGGLSVGGSDAQPFVRGFTGNFYVNTPGVTDLYWGSEDNNTLNAASSIVIPLAQFNLPNPFTPPHQVQSIGFPFYPTNITTLPQGFLRNYRAYTRFTTDFGNTRQWVHVVFVPTDVDTNLLTDVRFAGFGPTSTAVVQFAAPDVDVVTSQPYTNFIYLVDNVSPRFTNSGLGTNLVFPTYRPLAHEITRSTPFEWDFGIPENFTYFNGLLSTNYVSNNVLCTYHAYAAQVGGGVSFGTGNLTNPTNSAGRVEIVGTNVNMNLARVRAENLLTIRATNIAGATNMLFDAPFLNYNLNTTSNTLAVDALTKDTVIRLSGEIRVWSAHWTNFFITPGVSTNRRDFEVTFVDHDFVATQPVTYGDVYLKATNVVINDPIKPVQTFVVDAQTLTVGTGGDLSFPLDFNAAQTPNTHTLTNHGSITVVNSAQFGSDTALPYQRFYNDGSIFAGTLNIRATSFENSGTLSTYAGPMTLQFGAGSFSNSAMFSQGDLLFSGTTLDITNTTAQTAAALKFNVTSRLSDLGTNGANTFIVNDGFQFLAKPATGDLLGSTIQSVAPQFAAVQHRSALADRGATTNGYGNNAALGRLVLDGGNNTLFIFSPVGASNAIYVDFLEFDNQATNYLTSLQIDPGMTVYFADSSLPAEKLDGAHNGRLRWVSSYAGANSSVTVTNSDSSTRVVNRALRDSSTIDSDSDGIPNRYDTTPFDPVMMSLVLVATPASGGGSPSHQAHVSWEAAANTTYRVEFRPTFTGPWQLLQNYTHGSKNGTATVADPVTTNANGFYRVTYFY